MIILFLFLWIPAPCLTTDALPDLAPLRQPPSHGPSAAAALPHNDEPHPLVGGLNLHHSDLLEDGPGNDTSNEIISMYAYITNRHINCDY